LLHLTATNPQAALYFLRNDARPPKRSKGKEKEKERVLGSNAPINVLLGLLSKDTILSNSQLVDSLLALLSTITKPLLSVPKPEEKKREEKKRNEADVGTTATSSGQGAETEETGGGDGQARDAGPRTPGAATAGEGQELGKAGLSEGALTTMPVIPASRLSSIVKPLATAISSKGFQHTLAVASHLSAIDGAREVICAALQLQADAASRSLVVDLDALLSTLPERVDQDEDDELGKTTQGSAAASGATADTGIVIHGPRVMDRAAATNPLRIESKPLAALASPASAQAVLLRSLRALDYIMTGR
jgi:E3 ubiquitin-protein ligase HUWE1